MAFLSLLHHWAVSMLPPLGFGPEIDSKNDIEMLRGQAARAEQPKYAQRVARARRVLVVFSRLRCRIRAKRRLAGWQQTGANSHRGLCWYAMGRDLLGSDPGFRF